MKTSRTRKFADAVRSEVPGSMLRRSTTAVSHARALLIAALAFPLLCSGAEAVETPANSSAASAHAGGKIPVSETAPLSFGEVKWESQGFIKRSDTRPDLVHTLVLHPELATEGDYFDLRMDLQAIAFWDDQSSLTVESAEAYVGTSDQWSEHLQFTIGRRNYAWSAIDEEWQIGLWSPRFLWDTIRPQQLGMTGAFGDFKWGRWRMTAVASPVSLPERGFPIRASAGDLSSPSPDWVPPFQQVNLMNQVVGIRYYLDYPSLESLVLLPTAAARLRYGGEDQGFWFQMGGGLLPVHQIDISIQAELTTPDLILESTLHPRRVSHMMGTVETGYRSDSLSAWLSLTRENPTLQTLPSDWMRSPMGPSTILGGGLSTRAGHLSVTTSGMLISEELPEAGGSEVRLSTPPRYTYRRAIQARMLWEGESRLAYSSKWIYDIENESSVLMADMAVRLGESVRINLGADWFSSETRTGVIGQLAGNDRLRLGVAYAF